MPVCFENAKIGKEYTRPRLAELWGYKSYQALAKGIVTPAETPYIILFITEEKQPNLTQYQDSIDNNILSIEGEVGHTSDQRLINAEQNGDEIHLFYRKRHHMPFIYYGCIHLLDYEINTAEPSRFNFLFYKNTDITNQFELSFSRRQASYKMVTVLSLLDTSSSNVVSGIEEVARKFMEFYETRAKLGAMVESEKMAMARVLDLPFSKVEQVMISNPVLYLGDLLEYDKSANLLSFKNHVVNNLDEEMLIFIRRIALKNLYDYYHEIGGLCDKGLGYWGQPESYYAQRSIFELDFKADHEREPHPGEPVAEKIYSSEGTHDSSYVERLLSSHPLRECSNLNECEKILGGLAGRVKYFGQIELKKEDIDHLGNLISTQLASNLPAGIQYVTEKTPAALAAFLVGQGIYYYHEGDYWTPTANSLGVDDVNWQAKIGQEYLRTLVSSGKPALEVSGFHAYVANILLHGGIPQRLLPEFFETVIKLLVHKDLIEPDEIKAIVNEWRSEDKEYNNVARDLFGLNKRKKEYRQKKEQAEQILQVREEHEQLKGEVGDKGYLINALGDNYEEAWQKYKDDLSEINNKEEVLQEERCEHGKKIDEYYQYHAPVLKSADSIQAHINEYYREKKSLEIIPSLERQYMECRDELAEKIQSLNENNSLELQEPYLAKLPWEKVIIFFREAASLQELVQQKEGAFYEITITPAKPGGFVYTGILVTVAGVTLVMINPAQLFFWLFVFIGAVITVPGLSGYRSRKNAVHKEYQRKEALAQEIEFLRFKKKGVLDNVYELASDILPVEIIKYNEMADLFEDIHDKHEHFIDVKFNLQKAQEKADELKRKIIGFADLLGLENIEVKSVAELFLEAQHRIDEASSKRKQVEKIESEIKRIDGELIDLQAKRKELQGKIDYIEETLERLGEGDLERGRQMFSQYKEKQNWINDLEQTLCDEEAIFSKELLAYDLSGLNALLSSRKQYIKETDLEIAGLEKKVEALTRPLDYIDEPIRRFVLHGDEWAEGWLIESVRMYMQTMTGEGFKQGEESPLPERVVNAFYNWWDAQSSESTEQETTKVAVHQILKTPEIKIAPTGEIYLYFPFQRFYSDEASIQAWIRITDREGKQLVENIPLDVYKKEEGLLETESISISVLAPVEIINIAFGFGQDVLKNWLMRLFIEGQLPLMIFDEEGSLVFSDPLPREKLWFMFEESLGFQEFLTPLEEDTVGLDKTYYLQLIDTSKFPGEKISVVDANNRQHDLFLTGEEVMIPQLSGKAIDGVMVEESYPLYLRESISIYVPTVDLDELKDWLVQIRPRAGYPGIEASWNFEELQDLLKVQPGGNMALLPLEQIGLFEQEPCGRYTIYIFNPAGEKFNYDISFVDDLKVSFTPQICPPIEKDDQRIEMKLTCPEDLVFDVFEPAKLTETRGKVSQIAVAKASNYVHGSLRQEGVEESFFKLPLSITVPKIRWSVEGLKDSAFEVWNEKTEELWLGDWQEAKSLNLKISVPVYLNARARLRLEGTDQHYDREIKKGLAKFNLLPFTDTLKAYSRPAYFYLTLYDHDQRATIIDCLLFMVRVRWEIEDLSLEQNKEGEAFQYRFKWVDRGKMNDRILRLWDKIRPFNPPVMEKEIPDEADEIVFNAGLEELPPGEYLAQFAAENPWEATHAEVSFPQSDYNVFPVGIKGDQVVISSWNVQWIKQNEINVWGKLANNSGNLEINVTILGREKGKWVSWSSSAITDGEGCFNITFKAEKDFAHWIGITAENKPSVNLYAVIPDAAPIHFLLEEEVPEVIRKDKSGITAVQVYDKKDLQHRYPFYVLDNESVRQYLVGEEKEIKLRVKMADQSKKDAKLLADYTGKEHTLELEQGVRCTGKGCRRLGYNQIFPNQAAWYTHTQPTKSPECKSMEVNYENVAIKIVYVWNVGPQWERATKVFPFLEWPVLISSTGEKPENYKSTNELANKLLEQEKGWFEQLINTGFIDSWMEGKNEH